MAKFLNTFLISEWIERLIDETQKELIILVPYIKISDRIFKKLEEANARGVETVLVYRENQLHEKQKEKLLGIDNLNLLHHPNLHAKCYYNEKYLIIGSMNLYEYSEKNNREMGILLHKESIENEKWENGDGDKIFKEAVEEIRDVIKSSELEKESRDTVENGFELDIIKTEYEKMLEVCKKYNRYFSNKFFEPTNVDGVQYALCKNYYDRIDVSLDYRITIHFNLHDSHIRKIYYEFSRNYDEFMYNGFKFYWNPNSTKAYLYVDARNSAWNDPDEKDKYNLYKEALAKFINDIKPLMTIK